MADTLGLTSTHSWPPILLSSMLAPMGAATAKPVACRSMTPEPMLRRAQAHAVADVGDETKPHH